MINNYFLERMRYDYFLIWGHGLEYRDAIFDLIREDNRLSIIMILYHRPHSITDLVDAIYSYDYAPYEHLLDKTNYLLNTPSEVIFIFVKNHYPQVDLFGNGSFRHVESLTIKTLKETIRNRYNPRYNGKRTEDHIIHASDSEKQTHHILKYLGYEKGILLFKEYDRMLNTPYYMPICNHISLLNVRVDTLLCNTARGDRYNYKIQTIPLKESPQYKGLSVNIKIYEEYINRFIGGPLTEDYSMKRFLDLAEKLDYLGLTYEDKYIITTPASPSAHLIIDGLHRASVLAFKKVENIIIAEIGN